MTILNGSPPVWSSLLPTSSPPLSAFLGFSVKSILSHHETSSPTFTISSLLETIVSMTTMTTTSMTATVTNSNPSFSNPNTNPTPTSTPTSIPFPDSHSPHIQEGGDTIGPFWLGISFLAAIFGTLLSFLSIYLHLKNYRRPDLQRLIIRIIWMYVVWVPSFFPFERKTCTSLINAECSIFFLCSFPYFSLPILWDLLPLTSYWEMVDCLDIWSDTWK